MARMDVPGRWAGGFRAWDETASTSPPAAAPRRAGCCGSTRRALRELVNRWFPLAGHLIGGLHRTARSIESTVAAARRAGHARDPRRRARPRDQQPGGSGDPRRSTTSGRRCDALLARSAGWPTTTSPPPSSARSTSCAAVHGAARSARRRSRWPTARASSPTWLERHGVRRRVEHRLAAGRRRRRRGLVRAGRTRPLGDRALAPAWSGWRHDVGRDPAGGGAGVAPAGSPSWSPRCGPTPRWTARRASASTSATASRAR